MDVVVCDRGGVVYVDGVRVRLYRNRYTAHRDSRIVTENPEFWRDLPVDFPADWQPPKPRTADAPAEPAAKDVRAWATGQGIDVPSRGKLPAELVEQYKAAHEA